MYIGKTSRPIDERLTEHALHGAHNKDLEKAMQENDYKFVVLYESHHVISDEELCQIERTLIENIKPKYNILGNTLPYDLYSKKDNYVSKKYYHGISKEEFYGLLNLNMQITHVVYGNPSISLQTLKNDFGFDVDLNQTKEQQFGKMSRYKDITWNCGPAGFTLRSDMLGLYPPPDRRFFTYLEMTKGEDPETKGQGGMILPNCEVVFGWPKTAEELLIDLGDRAVHDLNYRLQFYEWLSVLPDNWIELYDSDLSTRMSLIRRPKMVKCYKDASYTDFIYAAIEPEEDKEA